MTFTLTATADNEHSPPRVLLEPVDSVTTNAITSLSLYRNGTKIRFDPVITGNGAVAYDYDAPFDQVLTYRADASELGVAVDWTESWASLASWTGSGWTTVSGAALSTGSDALIYRDASAAIVRLEVTDPYNLTVQLCSVDEDSVGTVLVLVASLPDGRTMLSTPAGSSTVDGSGSYTLTLAESTVAVAGDDWSTQMSFVDASGAPVTESLTRVQLLGPDVAEFLLTFGFYGRDEGLFILPTFAATDSTHAVYVSDSSNTRVEKFNLSGAYPSIYPDSYPGAQFFELAFGTVGTGDGEFDETWGPRGLAVDSTDRVWVCDTGNHRVQVFDSDGTFLFEFGTPGTGDGEFDRPLAIAIDSADHAFVIDSQNYRVQEFDDAGVYVDQFGTFGTGDGEFTEPVALTVTSDDHIWVADVQSAASRVQEFASGAYASQVGVTGGIHDVAADADDLIWVSGSTGTTFGPSIEVSAWVRKYDPDAVTTQLLAEVGGTPGSAFGQFRYPYGLAFDGVDLYVVDQGNSRVQKFTIDNGSTDDITIYNEAGSFVASDEATVTLSPSGDYAGAWLSNAYQPGLAVLAEASPVSGDDPYFIVTPTTKESTTSAANSVKVPIEGSADVVTTTQGPRRRKEWTLAVACTTVEAEEDLQALLADSSAILLRFPAGERFRRLESGFYSVGDVETNRIGHPQMGAVEVVTLPLTPARPPAYKALWQWNYEALAQSGLTYEELPAQFPTYQDLLVGPG